MEKMGLVLTLPDGKFSGLYSQMGKEIAEKVTLLDQDQEILIVNHIRDRDTVAEVLEKYEVEYEDFLFLLLPSNAVLKPFFTDYGFSTRLGHHFLFAKMVACFRFVGITTESKCGQALAQAEEHLLASWISREGEMCAVDVELRELIGGIARAYRCKVTWL